MKKYDDDWLLMGELLRLGDYVKAQEKCLKDPNEDKAFTRREITRAKKRRAQIEDEMARRAEVKRDDAP